MNGIAPVQRKEGGLFKPNFRPWPGEKLAIQTKKPVGAAGQTTTVDSAKVLGGFF